MQTIKNHVFRCYLRYIIICSSLFILFVPLSLSFQLFDTIDTFVFSGLSLVALAISFAAFQIRHMHKWNRKQLAITSINAIKGNLADDFQVLNDVFSYASLRRNEPIEMVAIQEGICTSNNDKKTTNRVDNAIKGLLDYHDYICLAVLQGVFEKEIVLSYYGNQIIRSYRIFSKYIDETNKKSLQHEHGSKYGNLKQLAVEFEERG